MSTMRPILRPFCLLAGLSLGAACAAHAAAADTAEAAARAYLLAESRFDQAALEAVLDPQFVEISPVGEVDDHDKVLSFYAADKKVPVPPLQIGDMQVRQQGDIAVATTQVTYAMQGQSRSLTVGMTAARTRDGWKLLSAQYTPVRPKPATAQP